MTKKEFLEQLEETLAGEVPNSVVYDNKQYYSKYIDSELWKGRAEEEIFEELGIPRLLAKTVIDMQVGCFFSGPHDTAYENYRTVEEEDNRSKHRRRPFYQNSRFIGIFAGILGILLIFFAVRLVVGVAALLIQYAWPILLGFLIWIAGKHFLKKIK